MNELLMLGEAAELVGVPYYKIIYALNRGFVKDTKRLGRNRVFSPADIQRLKAYFQTKKEKKNGKSK